MIDDLLAAGLAAQRRFMEESQRADQAYRAGTIRELIAELAADGREPTDDAAAVEGDGPA